MHTLSTSFMILRVLGLWPPYNFSSLWTRTFYTLYTYAVRFMVYSFVVTGIIHLIQHCRSLLAFSQDGFRLLAAVVASGKFLNIVMRRKTIIEILETLESDPCLPRDDYEISMQNEHNRRMRSRTLQLWMLWNVMISMVFIHTILHDIPVRKLPRKQWLPYDITTHGGMYLFTCSLQLITLTYLMTLMIGYDTLVWGLFLEISTKLNLLQYRFTNLHETLKNKFISNNYEDLDVLEIEKKLITDCVNYHRCILRLSKRINSTFGIIIFVQYVMSTSIVCLTVYNISGMKMTLSGFIDISIYLSSVLLEIFLFCACANEVTLENENIAPAVYAMDWVNFTPTTRKSIMIIGGQSRRPIIFRSGYFVTLSIESFKGVIKIAYSAYNALQSLH